MKVGINGFGRIGRSIYRIIKEQNLFDIAVINDINPEAKNMAYLLKYDSEYGRLPRKIYAEDDNIIDDGDKVKVFHKEKIEEVSWGSYDIDLVFDCSGVHRNVLNANKLLKEVKKVIITHSPDEVDKTIILGVNEDKYNPDKDNIISSSICDAVALSPTLKIMNKEIGVESGHLTTLHPWLQYQNLLDGPSESWAHTGELYFHYPIGRASTRSLIPKPTTAIEATIKVLPEMKGKMKCMSYRVPVPSVGAANIYLELERKSTKEEVREIFENYRKTQKFDTIHISDDPLVSIDYLGSKYAVNIDGRWIDIAGGKHLYLALWYDNEYGYSYQSVSLAKYIMEKVV